jgi:hypothetical protein
MKPLTEYLQENINEMYKFGIFESLESAGTNFSKIIGKIKEFCVKQVKNYGEGPILNLLDIYYTLTSRNVPMKDRVSAISCIIYIFYKNDTVKQYLPKEFNDDKEIIDYVFDFLEEYMDDTIKEKSQNTYNEWFKE